MKPFQEDLEVHLTPRQQRAVTQRPVRTGQTGLHDAGGTTDHHQRDQGHHQMRSQLGQTQTNRSERRCSQRRLLNGVVINGT